MDSPQQRTHRNIMVDYEISDRFSIESYMKSKHPGTLCNGQLIILPTVHKQYITTLI